MFNSRVFSCHESHLHLPLANFHSPAVLPARRGHASCPRPLRASTNGPVPFRLPHPRLERPMRRLPAIHAPAVCNRHLVIVAVLLSLSANFQPARPSNPSQRSHQLARTSPQARLCRTQFHPASHASAQSFPQPRARPLPCTQVPRLPTQSSSVSTVLGSAVFARNFRRTHQRHRHRGRFLV